MGKDWRGSRFKSQWGHKLTYNKKDEGGVFLSSSMMYYLIGWRVVVA